ncbi:MAG: hypothetical protein WCT77_06655 [Bacteroidota bacterium]|jgi:hypothetical protein
MLVNADLEPWEEEILADQEEIKRMIADLDKHDVNKAKILEEIEQEEEDFRRMVGELD